MDSGELKRQFGRHVQRLREVKGLTQEQLADRIGRSVDTVSNIERGVNATRIEVAYQIAKELGVGLSDLFAFEAAFLPKSEARRGVASDLGDLLDGCDDETATRLLDLVKIGLKLAHRG